MASINPTNPRTNPSNFHKIFLRIGDFENQLPLTKKKQNKNQSNVINGKDHSPYISIVLYRATLVQDPVLAYARAWRRARGGVVRAAASCARRRRAHVLG